MVKTQWTGSDTGEVTLPTGIVSMFYNQFYNVIPTMDIAGTNNSDGFFNGNPAHIHRVPFGYTSGKLICTVAGESVSVSPVDVANGTFTISSTSTGYTKCTYIPYNDAIKYVEVSQNEYFIPIRKRLTRTRKEHIAELLNALNSICNQIQVPIRRYSIGPFDAAPLFYEGSLSVNVPITAQLFQEIKEHIVYLNNYVVDNANILASINFLSAGDLEDYSSETINASSIERYRLEINNIEGEI